MVSRKEWLKPTIIIGLLSALGIGTIIPQLVNRVMGPPKNGPSEQELGQWKSQCAYSLEHAGEGLPSRSELRRARTIFNACNNIVEKGSPDSETYIDLGRAALFLWEYDTGLFKANVDIEKVWSSFSRAQSDEDAEIKATFYNEGFKTDFKDLAIENRRVEGELRGFCPSAQNRYSASISEYKDAYKDFFEEYQEARDRHTGEGQPEAIRPIENLDSENACIVIEQGHWIHNRDRVIEPSVDMYDIVLAHYSGTKHDIEHNALVSKGVVEFNRGKANLAVKLFQDALSIRESPEVRNNLASAMALASSSGYRDAADEYSKAAQAKTNDDNKKYLMLLSASYAYLLNAIFWGSTEMSMLM